MSFDDAQQDGHRDLVAVPEDAQLHRRTGCHHANAAKDIRGPNRRRSSHSEQNVRCSQAGLVGRAPRFNGRDQEAVQGTRQSDRLSASETQPGQIQTEPRMPHGIGSQRRQFLFHHVDWDREVQADVLPGFGDDRRDDTNDPAGKVEQRASATAGIHGRICLEILEAGRLEASCLGTEHTGGHRVMQAEGIPDRDHEAAHVDVVGIA